MELGQHVPCLLWQQQCITLEVDVDDADPMGNEPVFSGKEMIGRATSGCYGHSVGKSLALAYVESGTGSVGTELELEILDKRYPARVIEESPCDSNNEKLRV